MQYHPENIEAKWRKYWIDNNTYRVDNDSSKPKFYVLDMFPYPSGAGLHVGHPLGYIASDIFARYKRLKGFNVLHPMGYDAFGLPAEQYAIQTGVHPAVSTAENIKRYRSQLDNIGFSFDWSREVNTSSPDYYKWTQWIFLKLYAHYYDHEEQKALPITQLISIFEDSGNSNVKAANSQELTFTASEWKNMSELEKDLVLMNYRLAYRKVGYVNWCEALGTVLANDEVKDGLSERGGHPVERRAMMQWSLRITAYAERLLNDMNTLEWSDSLKAMQKNWIGRSEGAQLFFDIVGHDLNVEVFTTRPDTIFGATFMVLAPEHDLVDIITTSDQKESIITYIEYVKSRSEKDRMAEVKEVSGAFTGAYAKNPFSGEDIPIWIGEYVLKDYGTGAIMAVPSDDERDLAFAKKFGINIIEVVDKSMFPSATLKDKTGIIINSSFLNGLEVEEAIQEMFSKIETQGIGQKKINYKLRDANFSRQRYWGEPFPITYNEAGVAFPLTETELPIQLPDLQNFQPSAEGKSPLARLTDWVNVGEDRYRETDTMPGFAGSSWYFLRYMDANNPDAFASKEALDYWKEVDLYIGGTEHAVGHLMYSRFWHKFLFDIGHVPTIEPFKKLVNQGMIQGVIEYIYLQKEKENGYSKFVCTTLLPSENIDELFIKVAIHVDYVIDYGSPKSYLNIEAICKLIAWRPEYDDAIFECANGIYHQGKFTPKGDKKDSHLLTQSEVGKMSKRYFNVVNPDDVVAKYGADCFRMYEMFLGPIEQSKPWDTKGIDGVQKFLRKFWSLFFNDNGMFLSEVEPTNEEFKILHTAIKKVNDDIEKFSFNTSVSAFMVCVNELKRLECNKKGILTELVKLLAPFAPYVTEELWHLLGNVESVHHQTYPVFEQKYLVSDTIEYPVCINGKKRDVITIDASADHKTIESQVMQMEVVQKWLAGQEPKKFIVVPNRMINIVL